MIEISCILEEMIIEIAQDVNEIWNSNQIGLMLKLLLIIIIPFAKGVMIPFAKLIKTSISPVNIHLLEQDVIPGERVSDSGGW